MSWLDLLLLALATWYVSRVLTRERGPWDVLVMLRARWAGGPLDCIYCTSFWVAYTLLGLWTAFTRQPLWWSHFLVWGAAVAGLSLMLRSYTGVQHG